MKYIIKIIKIIFRLKQFIIRKNYILSGAEIGKNTYLGPNVYIDTHKPGKITIGQNCYITRNVVILCHTDTKRGGPKGAWEKGQNKRIFADVNIGNNVFIGVNSVIMPGVNIGDNSIIGALSLVNQDIPGGYIYAGNPAKKISMTKNHVNH